MIWDHETAIVQISSCSFWRRWRCMQEGQHGRIEAGYFEAEVEEGQDDKLLPIRSAAFLPTVLGLPYVPLDLVECLPSLRVALESRVYVMTMMVFRFDVSRPAVLVSPCLLLGLFSPFLPIVLALLRYSMKIPEPHPSRGLSRPSGPELP